MRPSKDEATHIISIYNHSTHQPAYEYLKVGRETVFGWNDITCGWVRSDISERVIDAYYTPIDTPSKSSSEPQERTLDRPAIGVQGGGPIVDCMGSHAALEVLCGAPVENVSNYLLIDPDNDNIGWNAKPLISDMTEAVDKQTTLNDLTKENEKLGLDYGYTPESADTVQVDGDHYKTLDVQPWRAIDCWLTKEQAVGYYLASAIAYLGRYNAVGEGKGGLLDVKKARHYLDKLIEVLGHT